MVMFQDNGIICINREIEDLCQGCLWLEWDRPRKTCLNRHTAVCPMPPQAQPVAMPPELAGVSMTYRQGRG